MTCVGNDPRKFLFVGQLPCGIWLYELPMLVVHVVGQSALLTPP